MARQSRSAVSLLCDPAPEGERMSISGFAFRIPLPPRGAPSRTSTDVGRAGRVVADFLRATQALSCEATAELAGVRAETIRKWRRRLPRTLKGATARRMKDHVTGGRAPAPDDGFRRLFRQALRSGPGPGRETAVRVSKAAVATPANSREASCLPGGRGSAALQGHER